MKRTCFSVCITLLALSFLGSGITAWGATHNTVVPQLDPRDAKIENKDGPVVETDLTEEPTYASVAPLWKDQQLNAECAVLGAKNSRAKFISYWNGAVGTLMYTDAAALHELTPFLPHSVLMVVGAGAQPDFRFNPESKVDQQLLADALPGVISRWEQDGLQFTQTAVARQIEGMEALTGSENTVGLVKVEVANPGQVKRRADLWVSLLAGMNRVPLGCDRTLDQAPYLEPLKLFGHDVMTKEGALRVALDIPQGANLEAHLNPDYIPTTWDAKAAPRLMERPVVAFKGNNWLGGWWGPGTGPTDLGVIWSKPVWVKQIRVFFDVITDKDYPVASAVKVQTWIGGQWTDVAAHVEHDAKPTDVTTSRAATVGYGGGQADGWTWTFEPVRSERLRVVLQGKTPKVNPMVQEVIFTYNKDAKADKGKGKWVTTRDEVASQNALRIGFNLAPGETKSICVKIPFLPASGAEAGKIKAFKFDAQLEAVKKFWRTELAKGMTLEVPDKRVQEVWNASLIQTMIGTDLEPKKKQYVTYASIGWYEYDFSLIKAVQIEALDNAGYHDEASKFLRTLMEWQGTMPPTGKFTSKEGFLTAAPEYSPMVYTANNGYELHALGRHYLLTRDREWLKTALPHMLASVDWIERERKTTKILDANGQKAIEYGLLPEGNECDTGTIDQYWYNETYNWQGLDEAAKVLAQIGHPRAKEVAAAARDYRQCILEALAKTTAAMPKYKLPNGEMVPFIPLGVHDKKTDIYFGSMYLDFGPIHLIETGVLPSESPLAQANMKLLEAYCMRYGLSLFTPFLCPHRSYYLDTDSVHKFLQFFYSYLCAGIPGNLCTGVEEWKGIQLDQFTVAEYLRTVQMMLVREKGGGLVLGQAAPRA